MNSIIQMLKGAITEWEFWSTAITSLVAVIALFQTNKQTKLSNKQNLFDRRLESYLFIDDLISRYAEIHSEKEIELDNELKLTVELVCVLNSPRFIKLSKAASNAISYGEYEDEFQLLGELRNKAHEISLIFSGKEAEYLCSFVLSFENLIKHLCWHIRYLDEMKKSEEQRELVVDKSSELEQAYKDIRTAFDQQRKIDSLSKIKKQIKL